MQVLIVHQPFGDYAVGQIIRDPAAIAKVKEGGQAHHCVAAVVPDDFFKTDDELKPVAPPQQPQAKA